MSAKCNSQNCNRKPDPSNKQNLCILCFDWYQKCQEQPQAVQQPRNLENYQNGQITGFSEEISTLTNNVKDLDNELSESKLKLIRLEYDFKEFEKKEEFQQKTAL